MEPSQADFVGDEIFFHESVVRTREQNIHGRRPCAVQSGFEVTFLSRMKYQSQVPLRVEAKELVREKEKESHLDSLKRESKREKVGSFTIYSHPSYKFPFPPHPFCLQFPLRFSSLLPEVNFSSNLRGANKVGDELKLNAHLEGPSFVGSALVIQ